MGFKDRLYTWVLSGFCFFVGGFTAATAETHREIQAVNADGDAVHPKVIRPGFPWSPDKRVILEGVCLNASHEIVDPANELLLAIQGEGDDHAGTQIWSGGYFQDWPEPYSSCFLIRPGDRVRVEGYVAQFIGKSNVNEQHSPDPARDFTVQVIGHPGMPVPVVVPDLLTANLFDPSRLTGGEYYQSRWVRINNVTLQPGSSLNWQSGQTVTVNDGTAELQMMLSAMGNFNPDLAPSGSFDVVGLFDQEPFPLNFDASRKEHYRLWVKRQEHILPAGSPFIVSAVSRKTHGLAGAFDMDISVPGAVESRLNGPTQIIVTFDRVIDGADGLDNGGVLISSGTIHAVVISDSTLTIDMSGVADCSALTIRFPGIVSQTGGASASQALCFGVLRGDVQEDGATNVMDLLATKNVLNHPLDSSNYQCDINIDGNLNVLDLLVIRNNLNAKIATACP